ncbi:MAG: HAD family acid phosphatase [Melioribacteraceae bacterium]|nr:HAD family acid phosphatase [Melioribacteraceae bacterium]
MKKNILFLFVLFFFGCSSQNQILLNLDTAKKLVQNYYESGEFDKECSTPIEEAKKELQKLKLNEKSLVVFDIDETALSNYNHTKEIGFGYVYSLWEEWLKKADAKAIPEVKKFYDWLIERNIKVAFITGRNEETYQATLKNLKDQGYVKFDTLITRNSSTKKIPAAEWKAQEREKLVNKGYEIVACIGDQWSDLVGGNTGIKIKLPNYLYIIE